MPCDMPGNFLAPGNSLHIPRLSVPPVPAGPAPTPTPQTGYTGYFATHPHLRDAYRISDGVQQSDSEPRSEDCPEGRDDGICGQPQGMRSKMGEIWKQAYIIVVDDEAPSNTSPTPSAQLPPVPPPNPAQALQSHSAFSSHHSTQITDLIVSFSIKSKYEPITTLLPPVQPITPAEEISMLYSSSPSHHSGSFSNSEYDSDSTVDTVNFSPTLRAPRITESAEGALGLLEERWRRTEERMAHMEEMVQVGMEIGGPGFEQYLVDYSSDSSSESDLSP
ncbi:hypothetical protein IAR50_006716 [Cryptococcus sp. DSM 104548]